MYFSRRVKLDENYQVRVALETSLNKMYFKKQNHFSVS